MWQRIDLAELYADALFELQARSDGTGQPLPVPQTCPFTLDDLLPGRPDTATLVAKLTAAAQRRVLQYGEAGRTVPRYESKSTIHYA